jgi:CubicO group peptidase (beta-lactamase class C family)
MVAETTAGPLAPAVRLVRARGVPAQRLPARRPGAGPGTSHPMGERSARETFGHNGSNACVAWADPTRRLAVAYLTAGLPSGLDRARHPSEVSDAILAACP